jgi:S-disulfanyl-L-cysteine oxidoreductase SoxD
VKTVAAVLAFLTALGMAQSTRDGVYTDTQAGRGEASYKKSCASCHGEKLDGSGQIPGLGGDEFEMMWAGQSLDDIFERIQGSMPADNPGKLSRTENADILAYVLKFNKLPAGSNELPSDVEALKKIRIEVAK